MEIANGSGTVDGAHVARAPGLARGARKLVMKRPVKRQNEQSSIAFPYMDMDAGISVARAIFGAGGVPLSRDQLAGVMKTNSGSGTFITKIATARMFGLIASAQGKYELTDLGFSITDSDEKRELAARADAFLKVPLYKRVYDEFKGRQLPPRSHGLEQAFAKFGVAPKQTYNARLAFDRSASQAGFFSAGPDRLIEPILLGQTGQTEPTRPTVPSPEVNGASLKTIATFSGAAAATGVGSRMITEVEFNLDPLIRGLLSRLPKAGEKWEANKRVRWLQTLAANFDMVYQPDDEDKIILIECKDTSNTS